MNKKKIVLFFVIVLAGIVWWVFAREKATIKEKITEYEGFIVKIRSGIVSN